MMFTLIQSGIRVPESTGDGLSGSIFIDKELVGLIISFLTNPSYTYNSAYIVSTNGL